MNYWLLKTEPSTYSWDDLVKDGGTFWDGVRNYAARKQLNAMKKGDRAFIYHSVKGTEIVGIAKITQEAYQDPSTTDDRWVAVDIEPLSPLKRPVSLQEIKQHPKLQDMTLVRISRLSVQPVTKTEYDTILTLSKA